MLKVMVNKDIREYTESLFLGLNLRQTLSLGAAIVIAAVVYVKFAGRISYDLLSLMLVPSSALLSFVGFFTYNGMPMEKVLLAIIKDRMIYPRRFVYKTVPNYFVWLTESERKSRAEKPLFQTQTESEAKK